MARKFNVDWFGINIPIWKEHVGTFAGKPNLRFLEIGCFEGRSTTWLLDNILTDKTSNITVVDTFEGSMEHPSMGVDTSNIYETFKNNIGGFEDKVDIKIGKSGDILKKFELGKDSFDFIYIDGSHMAKDVLLDAVLSWDLLKSNGILVFDDYNWGQEFKHIERPKLAIDTFLEIYKGEYELLSTQEQLQHPDAQVIIKKI